MENNFKWVYLCIALFLAVTFDSVVRGPMEQIKIQLDDILWTKRESLLKQEKIEYMEYELVVLKNHLNIIIPDPKE